MTEEPRNWDKELANIDKAIARQPAPPAATRSAGDEIPAGRPSRRFVALAWFWTTLAVVLAIALPFWPNDKSCGLRLVFFLGAAGIAMLMGGLGALSSWSYRRGLAHLLSLLALVWAGIMAVREILPRMGYAKHELQWTCPEAPEEPAPTTPAPTAPAPNGQG